MTMSVFGHAAWGILVAADTENPAYADFVVDADEDRDEAIVTAELQRICTELDITQVPELSLMYTGDIGDHLGECSVAEQSWILGIGAVTAFELLQNSLRYTGSRGAVVPAAKIAIDQLTAKGAQFYSWVT